MKVIDLTGQQFGELTVLERVENDKNGRTQWKCKCNCGNIVVISSSDLRHKNHPRKYCSNQCILKNKPIDLTGWRFERLQVIKAFNDINNKYNSYGTKWICKCDCGKEVIVNSYDLRVGKVKSCGCLRAELLSQKRSANLIGQRFGKLTVLNLIKTDFKGNLWQCKCDCGNLTSAYTSSLNYNFKLSCGCLKSKGEMTIEHYLQELNINYKREYYFKDLLSKNNIPLRFDFAIFNIEEKLLYLIEFDGIQHFEEGRWLNSILSEQQEKDNLKNEYCLNNNIRLIRFNYKELESSQLTLEYFKQKVGI